MGGQKHDFRSTFRSTKSTVLHDLGGFRRSPRVCKSLKNLRMQACHGRGRGFEPRRPRHRFSWASSAATQKFAPARTIRSSQRFLSPPRRETVCELRGGPHLTSYKSKESGEYVSHTEWHRCIVFGKFASSQPRSRRAHT